MNERQRPRAESLPGDVANALATDVDTRHRFDALPPPHRREFLNGIGEPKKPETRTGRIAGMLSRLKPAPGPVR